MMKKLPENDEKTMRKCKERKKEKEMIPQVVAQILSIDQ